MPIDSNDEEKLNKLIAEIESDSSEESKVLVEKQIQKNKEEQDEKDKLYDVGDKDMPEDEKGDDFW